MNNNQQHFLMDDEMLNGVQVVNSNDQFMVDAAYDIGDDDEPSDDSEEQNDQESDGNEDGHPILEEDNDEELDDEFQHNNN